MEKSNALTLSGFVGPSAEGLVRLFSTPNGQECLEIPETAILHYDQDDASGPTKLSIDPSVTVTVITTRKVPLMALARRLKADGGGTGTSCIDKRIERCKSDPDVHNKAYCDSEEARRLFDFFCGVLGNPSFSGAEPGSIA